MGAHVWGPAYLRDELLPHWQLNGWSMDWYAGMPAYRFYMVLPALAIVALDSVLAYGIAFKLVAISGLVLFPISCWSFGRMARFRYPLPELFAFAGLAFALDESFSIYGGNLKSTMAGEFSFSIALTLAMFGFGFLARGIETGKYKVWASVLLAAACVSHGIVLMFVAVVAAAIALIWIVVSLDVQRLKYAAIVGVTTVLLSLFWVGPFLGNHDFMTDMKYEPKPSGGCRIVLGHVLPAHRAAERPHHDAGGDRRDLGRPAASGERRCPRRERVCRRRRCLCVLQRWIARHRAPLEPSPPALHLPPPLPAHDGRPRRGGIDHPQPRRQPSRRAPSRFRYPHRDAHRRRARRADRARVPLQRSAWSAVTSRPAASSCTPGDRSTRTRTRTPARCTRPRAWAGPRTTSRATRTSLCTPNTTTSCRRWAISVARERLRSRLLGARRRQRQLRHADGADAVAVLDRRLHRLDGGSVLRSVGHDAVPLRVDGSDVGDQLRTRCASCATRSSTPAPASPSSSRSACAT